MAMILAGGMIGCGEEKTVNEVNTAPPVPSDPVPASEAINQDIGVRLEWICQDPDQDAVIFYVYFGTSNPPSLVDTAYTYLYSHDRLDFNTTYYWKIIADDQHGNVVESPLWSFTTGNFYLIDDYDTQDAYRVTVENGLIYVLEDNQGLRIFDLTDTSQTAGVRIDSVGMFATGGPIFDFTLEGDFAYMATLEGLLGIDISMPSEPYSIFTSDTAVVQRGEYGRSVEVVGDTAFLLTKDTSTTASYFKVVDVSDTANLSIIGQYQFDGIGIDVELSGDYALVADSLNGLRVFDISDRANPTLASTMATYGIPIRVFIEGQRAYIADGAAGLTIVNLAVLPSLEILGNIDTPGYARDVYVYQERAFIADYWNGGIQIADVSNPELPSIIDSKGSRGGAFGIYVGTKTLNGQEYTLIYFADAFMGLSIFEYNL